MNAHTPGPWRYCPQNGSPTTGMHMIAGSKPGYLAEVRDCGSGIVQANARLIAAAPELLEALETLADEEWRDDDDNILIDARTKARSAIAKARGKA